MNTSTARLVIVAIDGRKHSSQLLSMLQALEYFLPRFDPEKLSTPLCKGKGAKCGE